MEPLHHDMTEGNKPSFDLDVLLVHPPANPYPSPSHTEIGVFDADTGYTQQFASVSTGLLSMAATLEEQGFKTIILNLAEIAHAQQEKFAIETWLNGCNAPIIGISLHWWVHAWGALETARLLRKHLPKTFIVFGGLTASLFCDEILDIEPAVDAVLQGEADESLPLLAKTLLETFGKHHSPIPGLRMRNENGSRLRSAPPQPPELHAIHFSRTDLVFPGRLHDDRGNVTMFRGCPKACNYCGAGRQAYSACMGCKSVRSLPSEIVVNQLRNLQANGKKRLYLYGDPRLQDSKYIEELLERIHSESWTSRLVIEFFFPATDQYLNQWHKAAPDIEATFSPESGSETVRSAMGRHYSNADALRHCEMVAERGIPQSTYFMMCLTEQGPTEIEEDLAFAERVLDIFLKGNNPGNLHHDVIPFTLLQLPDPGSLAFLDPVAHGYRLTVNTLANIVDMLRSERWEDVIGYTTNWFPDKSFIVESFVSVCKKRAGLYLDRGVISDQEYDTHMESYSKKLKVINSSIAEV